MAKLRDYYGNPLKKGFYFFMNEKDGSICFIDLNGDAKPFSVESYGDVIKIKNYEEFSKKLIPLTNSRRNLEFLIAKIMSESLA